MNCQSLTLLLQTLGATIAALERAEACMVASSGMAAISSALIAVLRAGDHLLVQQGLYGGTHSLINHTLPGEAMNAGQRLCLHWNRPTTVQAHMHCQASMCADMGITHTEIDSRDPASWEAALQPNTKVHQLCPA